MYKEIATMNKKGNVTLVKQNGKLFVKKRIDTIYPEIYYGLKASPIENTPKIFEVFEDDGRLTVIEEYLSGITLKEKLENQGLLSEKEVTGIMLKLTDIIARLHSRGLVHRDIKPSNILIDNGEVFLLDFDTAKPQTLSCRDTVLLGTQGYAAPEQYGFGASTVQTDIYALGVCMNICLLGKLPNEFIAEGRLKNIIKTCVKPDPKDRYRNIKELRAALKRVHTEKFFFLPPGFRTLKWYKMIPALAFYIFVFMLIISMEFKEFDHLLEKRLFQFAIFEISLMNVAFFTNYLNIRRFFPLMGSRKKIVQILGYILAPQLILWGTVIVVVIIEGIFI